MWKKAMSLALAAIMLFCLSGCSELIGTGYFLLYAIAGDDRAAREEIIDFVRENEDKLLSAIAGNDFSAFENRGFIKDVDVNPNVVEFFCGGYGLGSSTSYVGFYYTPDNDMTAVWCAPASADQLVPSGTGFEWLEENGDNRYYTEKICDHFYYYEASF